MFDVSAADAIELASADLNFVQNVDRESMLGHADVRWSFVVLEKR